MSQLEPTWLYDGIQFNRAQISEAFMEPFGVGLSTNEYVWILGSAVGEIVDISIGGGYAEFERIV